MSYFYDMYSKLRYPRSDMGTIGLHTAQLGAIHAIASQGALNKKEADITQLQNCFYYLIISTPVSCV